MHDTRSAHSRSAEVSGPTATQDGRKKAPAAPKVAVKIEAPANWMQTVDNIRRIRQLYPAPVDSMGCSQSHLNNDKTIDQRFQVLVSLMLSSQTKDPITWAAVQKLRNHGIANVDGILDAKEKDIEDLIYPVGFYRRKAVYLKKVARILKDDYAGDIPGSVETLCSLPGVGPKMAHLCMQEAWNVNSGIGVDTHVHRIVARLGWVPSKGIKTPEDTRKALESWLPSSHWRELNHLLVGFGQTICKPVGPRCTECLNSDICPKIGVDKPKRTPTSPKKPESASQKKKPKKEPKVEVKADPDESAEIDLRPLQREAKKQAQARIERPRRTKIKVEPKKEPVEPMEEDPESLPRAVASEKVPMMVEETVVPMVRIKQERVD